VWPGGGKGKLSLSGVPLRGGEVLHPALSSKEARVGEMGNYLHGGGEIGLKECSSAGLVSIIGKEGGGEKEGV